MATFVVTMKSGYKWRLIANLSEAGAPLEASFHETHGDDDCQSTPFQTADARHNEHTAANMVWDYFYQEGDNSVSREICSVLRLDNQASNGI